MDIMKFTMEKTTIPELTRSGRHRPLGTIALMYRGPQETLRKRLGEFGIPHKTMSDGETRLIAGMAIPRLAGILADFQITGRRSTVMWGDLAAMYSGETVAGIAARRGVTDSAVSNGVRRAHQLVGELEVPLRVWSQLVGYGPITEEAYRIIEECAMGHAAASSAERIEDTQPTVAVDGGDQAGWRQHGNCANTDGEAFFPEKNNSPHMAKKVCARCSVRQQCLDYALAHNEQYGTWGGLTERERRKLKKRTI